jgi:hypothetical protein
VKLDEFIAALTSDSVTADEKREALRFVIHFVADIHRPLHCANHDQSGNDFPLVWKKRKTNLNEIWDHYVLVNTLNQVMDTNAGGTIVDWCNESHALAQQVVYAGLPELRRAVSEEYVGRARTAATDQLAKAAARLAEVLNASLR